MTFDSEAWRDTFSSSFERDRRGLKDDPENTDPGDRMAVSPPGKGPQSRMIAQHLQLPPPPVAKPAALTGVRGPLMLPPEEWGAEGGQ